MVEIESNSNLIPRKAYLYMPSEQDIIELNTKNPHKTLRRIFEGGVEYTAFELKSIQELKSELLKQNENQKNTKNTALILKFQDHHLLRFLQANQYKYSKTIEMLNNHIEWRKKTFPLNISDKTKEALNTGFIYVYGRDQRFRPVIIINAHKFVSNKKKFEFDHWEQAVVFILEYVINNLLLPGQIENWNIICDLKDCSLLNLPSELKKVLASVQNNYRCRLFVMFMVNVSSFTGFLWGMIKSMIDETTEKKIRMVKANKMKELQTLINPEQLEVKYGGILENLTEFYPPRVLNDECIMRDESKILISEDVYIEKIKRNKKLVRSPFIKLFPKDEGDEENKVNHNDNDNDNGNEFFYNDLPTTTKIVSRVTKATTSATASEITEAIKEKDKYPFQGLNNYYYYPEFENVDKEYGNKRSI